MIDHPDFTVEPWCLRATDLDLDVLAQTESVFALSNGQIGWRANLDEGEPHGLPGSYLNGVFEERPLPYAEAGYGYPESGQTVINVTNGKLIRLLVDDEPFDIRYGELWTSTTSNTTPATACTSPRWRGPGPLWSSGSVACVMRTGPSVSPHDYRPTSPGSRSPSRSTKSGCGSR